MATKNNKTDRKAKFGELLKKDFDRDLKEIDEIVKEIMSIFSSKSFDLNKILPNEKTANPLDYIMNIADKVKENYGETIVEFAALSYCIRAIVERFTDFSSGDIMIFQANKRNLVQILNDISRTIRRLRNTDLRSFKEILDVFDESFSMKSQSKQDGFIDSIHKMVIMNIQDIKSNPETTKMVKENLIDILVKLQLIIGIVLKWIFIAEEELVKQVQAGVKDIKWDEVYNKYIQQIVNSLSSIKEVTM